MGQSIGPSNALRLAWVLARGTRRRARTHRRRIGSSPAFPGKLGVRGRVRVTSDRGRNGPFRRVDRGPMRLRRSRGPHSGEAGVFHREKWRRNGESVVIGSAMARPQFHQSVRIVRQRRPVGEFHSGQSTVSFADSQVFCRTSYEANTRTARSLPDFPHPLAVYSGTAPACWSSL